MGTSVVETGRKLDFLTNNSTPNIVEKARVVDQNGKIGAEIQSLKIWKQHFIKN